MHYFFHLLSRDSYGMICNRVYAKSRKIFSFPFSCICNISSDLLGSWRQHIEEELPDYPGQLQGCRSRRHQQESVTC